MSAKQTRGVTEKQTLRNDSVVRDIRTLNEKVADWLRVPNNMALTLIGLAVTAFVYPAVCDVLLFISLGLTAWGLTRVERLPLKLPILSGMLDPNERHPATGNASPAGGIFFLGNELKTGREVWLTNSDCRQHFLVLGTTGAGKTEALIGFAANAVTWGSGFLFCDGKGDVALFAKVYALARRFGREDDLLVLNFMTGNMDVGPAAEGKLMSNNMNPFSTGSSDTLTQMVVGLMDDAGGDGAMWKGRATAMFTGVMRALTWLREEQIIDLNVGEIRDHLNLKRIIDLADQQKYPDMPQHIRKSIRSYLNSLPGYQEDKGHKQAQTTLDQHGYLEMQFTKILGSLADVYGHIFKTPYGEIDMADVVLNRRILVVMLPALEKASAEIANLGKIVVATLKGMMGGTLGSQIEGNWFGVVEQRPTTSPTPFICILDEVGYYMVDGMDLMSAQARSLGFALVFAGQDINAMKRINEKVFDSVRGNTNTKIIMRTEDHATAELAQQAAGEALRAVGGGLKGHMGDLHKSYRDGLDVSLTKEKRIDAIDLKAQDEGEMHILHKEWIVRAKSFYAAPESSLDRNRLTLRANHFITVAKPDREEIQSSQRLPEIVQRLVDPSFAEQMKTDAINAAANVSGTDEVASLALVLKEINASKRRPSNPVEIAVAAFAKIMKDNRSVSETYAGDVRSATQSGRRAHVDARHGNHMPRDAETYDGISGSTPLEYDEHAIPARPDRIQPDFNATSSDRSSPPKRPISKPLGRGLMRGDVRHGVSVDHGELLDMAAQISENDSTAMLFRTLDFDASVTTRDQAESAIETALRNDRFGEPLSSTIPDFGDDMIDRADIATRSALPNFEEYDEDDEGGGDDGNDAGDAATTDFLKALIREDEN